MSKTKQSDDAARQEKLAHMQALWTEGLESGISDRTIDEIFEDAVKRHKVIRQSQ